MLARRPFRAPCSPDTARRGLHLVGPHRERHLVGQVDADTRPVVELGELEAVDGSSRGARDALGLEHAPAAVIDEPVEQEIVQAALEAASEQVPELPAAAHAVEQVGGGAHPLGAQVDCHRRPRVMGPVRVPAGTQHRRGRGVLERGRVDESVRLAGAGATGAELLHPAKAADAQGTATLIAQGRERARGEPGDPGVEPVARQAERLS